MTMGPFEGFSKLKFRERQARLQEVTGISQEDLNTLIRDANALTIQHAENLIENVIGVYSLPIGLATHFKIDGKNLALPMVVEETSIVAAASAAAKWVYRNDGFKTRALGRLIIGQVQFPTISDPIEFSNIVDRNSEVLMQIANLTVPNLQRRGGGIVGLQVRNIKRPDGKLMAVLHVLCDPCDAMGANLINIVCEALKSPLEELTKEKVGLCILSNLVDTKLFEASCEIKVDETLGKAIEEATLFANLDPYRAATHNKGVMNGVDPILIATGNDWRAVEAGVHAYASRTGRYQAITDWKYRDGVLSGKFLAPLAVGTVGGMTRIHPTAQVCLKILGVEHSEELARICAAAGLAQNLGALRALCTEGIVQGHMRLHASNLAIAAGAEDHEIQLVGDRLRQEKQITFSRAKELLSQVREQVREVFIEHGI